MGREGGRDGGPRCRSPRVKDAVNQEEKQRGRRRAATGSNLPGVLNTSRRKELQCESLLTQRRL